MRSYLSYLDRFAATAYLQQLAPDGLRLLPLVFDDQNYFFAFDGCGWWTSPYLAVGLPGVAVGLGEPPNGLRAATSEAFEIAHDDLLAHLPVVDRLEEPCANCGGSGTQACDSCHGGGLCVCERCDSEHDCAVCDGDGSRLCKRCRVHQLFREPVHVVVALGAGEFWFNARLLRHGLQVFPPGANVIVQVEKAGDMISLRASTGERMLVARCLSDADRARVPTLVLRDGRATWAPAAPADPAVEA